jgi:hypothetical protein
MDVHMYVLYSDDRYYTCPRTKKQKPRKVIYYFPLHVFVNNLYAREDLIPYLWLDTLDHVSGHVARSRGFGIKVTNNPHMNAEHRNLALVGCTDGVPFFKDQLRGGWPFVVKVAQLPDGMAGDMRNCHVCIVQANEFWCEEAGNIVRKRVRAPKSFIPALTVFVDDLYNAYHRGVHTMDVSRKEMFWCRIVLLYMVGDYKAQATVSGFSHQGGSACHFCTIKVRYDKAIQREVFGDFRRWLGTGIIINVIVIIYVENTTGMSTHMLSIST